MIKIDFFNVNKNTLNMYLKILNKTEEEFYEIQKLVNNYTTNLEIFNFYREQIISVETEYEYLVHLKHFSTQNDESINFFENGFKTLKEMV